MCRNRILVLLPVLFLIALVLSAGCADVSFGSSRLGDLGDSPEAKEALAWYTARYGNPADDHGPPAFREPMTSTHLTNFIPDDRVIRLSRDSPNIWFWTFYTNFQEGDRLTLVWTDLDRGRELAVVERKATGDFGRAYGEFVRPDQGWPLGNHRVTIIGGGTSTQTTVEIWDGPTEAISRPFAAGIPSPGTGTLPWGTGGGTPAPQTGTPAMPAGPVPSTTAAAILPPPGMPLLSENGLSDALDSLRGRPGRSLPLGGVIPDQAEPLVAVAVVFGVAAVATVPAVSKSTALFLNRIKKFIMDILGSYLSERIWSRELTKRYVVLPEQAGILGDVSVKEVLVVVGCAPVLAIAFLLADRAVPNGFAFVRYVVIGALVPAFHELMHRIAAYRYRQTTEVQFWGLGTAMMFLTAWFTGSVFGMPFATVLKIEKDLPYREQAIIMLAGPAMSLALSLAFLVMVPLGGSLALLGIAGCGMNLVATVSALLPFSPMDGEKIRIWNWMAWLAVFIPVLALYFVAYL